MYSSETRHIKVTVKPQYLEGQSDPDQGTYFWAYTILIENRGVESVQLLTRHWKITDSNGAEQIVHGDGVIGEQPSLNPGEHFEYTSGAPLKTPSGFMVGSYGMINTQGEHFDIAIPLFSLDSPHTRGAVH
ncbi:MAG: Co2+/Mg2+ efflux protein ApaG [Hyphomicrobiales bacterium]